MNVFQKFVNSAKTRLAKYAAFVAAAVTTGVYVATVTIGAGGEWIYTVDGESIVVTDSLKYSMLDSSEVRYMDSLAVNDIEAFQDSLRKAFWVAFPYIQGEDTIKCTSYRQYVKVGIRKEAGDIVFEKNKRMTIQISRATGDVVTCYYGINIAESNANSRLAFVHITGDYDKSALYDLIRGDTTVYSIPPDSVNISTGQDSIDYTRLEAVLINNSTGGLAL